MTNKLEVINNSMPYTYHLFHSPTNKHYYGVRYAANADPSELGLSYFSSSKEVHELIAKYGKSSFTYTVRKIFEDPKDAILWESKFLHRIDAKNNPNWINRHNGDGEFSSYGEMPNHQRRKISNAKKGQQSRGIGWSHSKETVEKIRQGNLGKHSGEISALHRQNISEGMKQSLAKLSPTEKRERMKASCCSPESYTKERSQKISDALTGKPKTDEHKRKLSKQHTDRIKSLSESDRKDQYGKQNKGRTWRMIDGKRQWFDRE
jgi:hypothetical protein